MKKFLLIPVLCVFCLISCKKNDTVTDAVIDPTSDAIVLIERESSAPFLLSNKTSKDSQGKLAISADPIPGDLLDIKYYLGRSYNTKIGEIGTPDGIKFPIIDIERLYADNPDYFRSLPIGNSTALSFSFSDFSRYEAKSNNTEKISGGLSLNLGLFSIGTKHEFEKTFTSEVVNDDKRVFGVLNVKVRDAFHELLLSSNGLKIVKEDYLNATFLDELYNTSTSEFINNYGGFFITDFISGGRADAYFSGKYLVTTDTQTKEGSMDNSVNASFTFDEKDSKDKSSIDFGIGNTNGSTIARTNNIGEFITSVKTYGGNYGFGSFTVPKSIDEIKIDLGSWAASLNDRSKHVLIDFNKNGLRPIADFISQDNIRFNINKYLTEDSPSKPLEVPRIEARWVSMMAGGSGFVTVVLRTRFGDELQISDNGTVLPFPDMDAMLNFAKQEAQKKLPFYKVAVTARSIDLADKSLNYVTSIADIDEASMRKFYDEKHKMQYLLSQVNGRNFAYAIHNDFLLDTYAIRDWVNSLAIVQVTPAELETYTIVAL